MAKHKVLSTKKLEPSLIEQAKKKDIEIIEQEAIKVNPVLTKENWDKISEIIGSKKEVVVFTSSNAVIAVDKYLHDFINPFEINWKIFCLAGKTKEIVQQKVSFGSIIDTADHSKELAKKIIDKNIKEVVFFCGNKRRDELPTILKEVGINVYEVIVYETIETPVVITENVDAVLFFSPSAVQSFFSVNQLEKNTVCFAIGETTANSITDFADNKIIISQSPDQETLLASVQLYFENSNCYE